MTVVAAGLRWGALVLVAAVTLTGCSYSTQEPGFLPSRAPAAPTDPGPERRWPDPTNPELPVAGESVWTTADRLDVTVRFAVHAVRRVPGATVLDWSITPLAAPGLSTGDDIGRQPDLGLTPADGGDVDILLVDGPGDRVFYPLRNRSRRTFNHCLCTPPWLVQQELRIGETRLLQVAYAALPEAVDHVDVALPNVAPVVHVPVTPEGRAPTARHPVDLARPAAADRAPAARTTVRLGSGTRQIDVRIERIVAGPDETALEWSLRWAGDRENTLLPLLGDAIGGDPGDRTRIVNTSPTGGPRLRVGGSELSAAWARGERYGEVSYDCRCSDLGLWAQGFSRSRVTVQVLTSYPALPPGTRSVDVVLPTAGVLRDVPVTRAEDAATRVGPSEPRTTGTWHYALDRLPSGWTSQDWPTDTPEPTQLSRYVGESRPVVAFGR